MAKTFTSANPLMQIKPSPFIENSFSGELTAGNETLSYQGIANTGILDKSIFANKKGNILSLTASSPIYNVFKILAIL